MKYFATMKDLIEFNRRLGVDINMFKPAFKRHMRFIELANKINNNNPEIEIDYYNEQADYVENKMKKYILS